MGARSAPWPAVGAEGGLIAFREARQLRLPFLPHLIALGAGGGADTGMWYGKNQTLPKDLVRKRVIKFFQPRSNPTYDFKSVSKKLPSSFFTFSGGIFIEFFVCVFFAGYLLLLAFFSAALFHFLHGVVLLS